MLGQALPAVRISTPLAERSVQVYHAKITSSKWEELSREDRDKIIAQAAYCCELDDLPEYLEKEGIQHVDIQTEQENAEVEPLPKPTKLSHNHSQDPISSENELPQEASLELTDTPTARPVMATTDEKLLVLMDGCSLDDPFDKINRVQITDSGGQPQFHEVLPIFLRGTSVYVFFQKLSEKLDAYSTVEYFDENGQSVCTPYQASHTNLQTFQYCLRVIHSQKSNLKGGKEKSARIIVIGTFEDEAHKCSEKIETKNKRFLELLLPSFKKEVVYYDLNQPKKVIFPLNASNPGEAGEKIIDQVRSLISTECTADPVEVPLQWHALESLLEEMAEILKRDVLTKEECFQVAKEKLHFDEDSFDAALEYLDQLNVIFYFPEILPNVIFANTQVLLDKVTELVLVIHQLRHGLIKMAFTATWQRFNDHALVSEEFLAQIHFSKHYVPRCFTEKELVVLFNEVLVFAKFNETEFFMPALLRMLSKEEVDKYRVDKSSAAAPVVITFSGDVPCLGVFCASVVFLLSSKNRHPCQWEMKMTDSSTPSCLYRNCVEFEIPDHPVTVTFIDAFKHFEIHLQLSECVSDHANTICPLVRSAIFEALHNADLALHYKISEPSLCLLCPCGVEECHAAKLIPKYHMYICSQNKEKNGQLTLNHLVWSEANVQSPTSDRQLTECDIPQFMEKLAPHAAKWWEIGTSVGFLPSELTLISANPMLMCCDPNIRYLADMLTKWVQWSPETVHTKYATIADLRQALRSQLVRLGAAAETV